jgi:hypothetical protein
MFAILGKAKVDTENTRGLNLAAVKFTTAEVNRLPLYSELHKIGNDLMSSACIYTCIFVSFNNT